MSRLFPKKQRALVLQGGGSLGAYEAGVYQALCERIIHLSITSGIAVSFKPVEQVLKMLNEIEGILANGYMLKSITESDGEIFAFLLKESELRGIGRTEEEQ